MSNTIRNRQRKKKLRLRREAKAYKLTGVKRHLGLTFDTRILNPAMTAYRVRSLYLTGPFQKWVLSPAKKAPQRVTRDGHMMKAGRYRRHLRGYSMQFWRDRNRCYFDIFKELVPYIAPECRHKRLRVRRYGRSLQSFRVAFAVRTGTEIPESLRAYKVKPAQL